MSNDEESPFYVLISLLYIIEILSLTVHRVFKKSKQMTFNLLQTQTTAILLSQRFTKGSQRSNMKTADKCVFKL